MLRSHDQPNVTYLKKCWFKFKILREGGKLKTKLTVFSMATFTNIISGPQGNVVIFT